MPRKNEYKRKPKPRYRRRNHRKRNYRRLVSNSVPSGMPTTKIANLRYVETTNVACTTGVLNEILWRANGIYDPRVAVGGHQPMGFDQWSVLYNHYVVVGSKITIKVINDTTVSPAMCGVYLSDGQTLSYTTPEEYIEARKGTYRMIQPTNPKTLSLSNKFSAKRFYNIVNIKDNVDRLGSPIGQDPGEQAYYHIWYQTLDSSSDTIRFTVTIDYIVLFSEPKDLTQS